MYRIPHPPALHSRSVANDSAHLGHNQQPRRPTEAPPSSNPRALFAAGMTTATTTDLARGSATRAVRASRHPQQRTVTFLETSDTRIFLDQSGTTREELATAQRLLKYAEENFRTAEKNKQQADDIHSHTRETFQACKDQAKEVICQIMDFHSAKRNHSAYHMAERQYEVITLKAEAEQTRTTKKTYRELQAMQATVESARQALRRAQENLHKIKSQLLQNVSNTSQSADENVEDVIENHALAQQEHLRASTQSEEANTELQNATLRLQTVTQNLQRLFQTNIEALGAEKITGDTFDKNMAEAYVAYNTALANFARAKLTAATATTSP